MVRPDDLADPDTLASVLARLDEVADDYPAGETPVDSVEAELEDAYEALGVAEVRRHRLGLPDAGLAGREADVVAALSAAGPSYRLPRRRARAIVPDLRAAAEDLSTRLGWVGSS